MENIPLEKHMTPEAIQIILGSGDLAKLSLPERSSYIAALCEQHDLDPLGRPFSFISGGEDKVVLFATRNCSDQLRFKHDLSVVIMSRGESVPGIYCVEASVFYMAGENGPGRKDEAIGAVSIAGLSGMALANAIMSAETKAKRRATLSLFGIGMIDESEVSSVPGVDSQEKVERVAKTDQEKLAELDEKILAEEKQKAIARGEDPSQQEPWVAPAGHKVTEVEPVKRKRRTKEQIEADKAAAGATPIEVETAAGEPAKEETAEPVVSQEPAAPQGPAWKSHKITVINHPKYHGRLLGDLTDSELYTLKGKWCPNVADNALVEGLVALRDMIFEAIAFIEANPKPAAETPAA